MEVSKRKHRNTKATCKRSPALFPANLMEFRFKGSLVAVMLLRLPLVAQMIHCYLVMLLHDDYGMHTLPSDQHRFFPIVGLKSGVRPDLIFASTNP